MVELIAQIILVSSLIGMGVIIFRKISQISELPEIPNKFDLKKNLLKLKEKIKILNPFKNFSPEIFLQKILSKIRTLTLKVENKITNWLQKLREKSLKRKNLENDKYWEEVKKMKKEK